MTDAQLLERLAGTDAFAADVPVPDQIWTPDVALREIERRSGMQTQEQKARKVGDAATGPRQPRRGWLVPALAAGLAVVIAIFVVASILGGGDDEPDVTNEAPLTPLEVGEAMNQAHVNGDWEAERRLYADDATYTDLASTLLAGSERSVENIPFSSSVISLNSPYDRPEPVWPAFGPQEWDVDGDGVRTLFDVQLIATATEYAAGVTRLHTCTQTDATTIVCVDVLDGWPFLAEPSEYQVTNTYTVVDGLITHRVLDYTNTSVKKLDAAQVISYQEWVRANRPELEDRLFAFFGSLAIAPSNIETHRELIAEWKAQG